MILIAGLGNPGRQYRNSRHNLGFRVLQEIANRWNVTFKYNSICNAFIAKKRYDEKEILLVLPQAYMNNSGIVVKDIMQRKKILAKDLLIIYDDIDLPFGNIRIKSKGSAAGHRGVKSIIGMINTQNFSRIRVGIGKPPLHIDAVDYVLDEFTKEENKILKDVINNTAQCCLCWIKEGIDSAMAQFN